MIFKHCIQANLSGCFLLLKDTRIILFYNQIRYDPPVQHMMFRSPDQRYISDNSGKPPHILIFQITAITEFVDDHRQHVFPILQCFCHIEFSCVTRSLAVSYECTVEPYVISTFNSVKPQDIFPVFLFLLLKCVPINTRRIVCLYARIIQNREQCYRIIIMWIIITIQLPVSGNRHHAKLPIVICLLHTCVRNIKR